MESMRPRNHVNDALNQDVKLQDEEDFRKLKRLKAIHTTSDAINNPFATNASQGQKNQTNDQGREKTKNLEDWKDLKFNKK